MKYQEGCGNPSELTADIFTINNKLSKIVLDTNFIQEKLKHFSKQQHTSNYVIIL